MRPLITLSLMLFALVFALPSYSQKDKDIPAWGKIDKADLEMKECDFDKDAEAVVLFDVAELFCDQSYNIQLERRIRIKILKEKGLSQADVKLPYIFYRNAEKIQKLSAQTYNLDASGNVVVTQADKKTFFDKKINNRYAQQIFSFADVKVGSVLEYKYVHSGVGLVNWYFQGEIPSKLSQFRTDFPSEVELSAMPVCVLPYESAYDPKAVNAKIYTMRNVPALRDEPYISNDEDYLQRLEISLTAINIGGVRQSFVRSWPGIIKQLMEDEDFGVQLKRDIPRTADLDEQLKKLSDPYEKMRTIHQYVRKNMTWNGYNNIWAFDGVKSAWKDKKGTTGEINLILVNLLKDAGLNAAPILVSTRDYGRVNAAKPGFQQFNEVLAFVKIGSKQYYLDATDKYTPSHLIPQDLMFSEGLVIKKLETFEWGWQTMWDEKMLKKKIVVMRGEINDKDEMKGEANVNSIDYDRLERLPVLKDGKDKLMAKYFSSNTNIKIDTLEVENEDNDSLALVQKIKFTHPVGGSGEYRFFNINMFTGLEKNPFVAEDRFSDVFFGTNQSVVIIGSFTIPEGATFEELPKNLRMIMPDTSIEISRRVAAEKNVLSIRMNLEFKRPYYSRDEYPDFREFYKKLFDLLNEQIVYRRKTVPKP